MMLTQKHSIAKISIQFDVLMDFPAALRGYFWR